MAKILFIVNEHASEPFAISVAIRTKKLLEAAGHKVIWQKVRARDTYIGRTLLTKGKKKIGERELLALYDRNEQRIKGWIERHKPAVTYTFHCTPAGSECWTYEGCISNRSGSLELQAGAFSVPSGA